MKPELFVTAFLLVMGGVCLVWARHNGQLQIAGIRSDNHHIVVNADDYHEELEYAGRIGIAEDETAVQSMSPDGFLRYTRNDSTIEIVNDTLHHRLTYTFLVDGNKIDNDSARAGMTQQALAAMFRWGYMGAERMEKLYRRGGAPALLKAMPGFGDNGLRARYANKILQTDTTGSTVLLLTQYLAKDFGDGPEKEQVLQRYTPRQWKDTAITTAYLSAVGSVRDEAARSMLIQQYLKQNPGSPFLDKVAGLAREIQDDNLRADMAGEFLQMPLADSSYWPRVLGLVSSLRDEGQKTHLLLQIINDSTKGEAPFPEIMKASNSMPSSDWRADIYRALNDHFSLQDAEWQELIAQIAQIPDENEKSELLLSISKKKAAVPEINTALKTAAKSIHDDALLGRVMRELN